MLIAELRADQAESQSRTKAEVECLMTHRLMILLIALMPLEAMADDSAILDKDFALMMTWLPGIYDNQEQVYFEDEQDVADTLRHVRVHTVLTPVNLTQLGAHG